MTLENSGKKLRRKKLIINFSIVSFALIMFTKDVSAFSLESWYQNNADILENNSVGGMAIRYISWGITKLLVLLASTCENIYDTAFGFIDFTESETFTEWIEKFKPAIIALMAASLLWLGITLIMQHAKKPKVVTNICICILCVCCSTLIFTELNSFANSFKEGVQKTVTASKISYSTINNNIADLVYLNDKNDGLDNVNWSEKKEYGAGIIDKKTFNNINYTEVLNYKSSNYNYKGETENILKQQLIMIYKDGKPTASVRENYNGFGWNSSDDTDLLNEFYYRYTLDSVTTWMQLIACIIIFFTMSYKCVRVAYELLVARVLAYLFSAEISGGEKIKKILIFIRDSYILLCVTVVCIKLYDMMNSFLVGKTEGLAKGLFSLFIAFCVIDGPNLVEKLIGMDAGLKSSTARMMAIGSAALGVARGPKSLAKKAEDISSGKMARGGVTGGLVGMIAGRKQEDGSRVGGLISMMNGKSKSGSSSSSGGGSSSGSGGSSGGRSGSGSGGSSGGGSSSGSGGSSGGGSSSGSGGSSGGRSGSGSSGSSGGRSDSGSGGSSGGESGSDSGGSDYSDTYDNSHASDTQDDNYNNFDNFDSNKGSGDSGDYGENDSHSSGNVDNKPISSKSPSFMDDDSDSKRRKKNTKKRWRDIESNSKAFNTWETEHKELNPKGEKDTYGKDSKYGKHRK